ncbi:MAG: hypothetical protein K0S00_1427 [Xanthobacteraceae bacterium]|nr:hypothetical protein [Xanthobacteraceae bacterium]
MRSLARRIQETEEVVDKWVRLAEPVPSHMQKRITIALGVEAAKLFTDVKPQRVTPPGGELAGSGGRGTTSGDEAGEARPPGAPGNAGGAGEPEGG